MPEFLPPEHICTAVRVNANNTAIMPIVSIGPHRQMVGQEPHIVLHCAIPHDIYPKHILLPPLTIDQSFLAEANLAPHLELHPTAGVVGAVASPILGRGSYNVDHCIDQASNSAHTIAPQLGSPPRVHDHTLRHSRWPIGSSRRLLSNGRIGGGSRFPGNSRRSCCQFSNASLLVMIQSCHPCRPDHRSASHNGKADRVPGLAHNAVAVHGIIVGVGACTTLPCNNLGRR
jgi:hypothetical protein